MIKACEEVAQAAGGLSGLLQMEVVTPAEGAAIAAIRRHLAKQTN